MQLEVVTLKHGAVVAQIVPARGALVTSIVVAGRELLFLDRATLEDPDKNVRGGIPVLFPFAGKLVGERFLPAGTTMKQHGFGRNRPWSIAERRDERLRLALVQDAGTRAQYPYEYQVEHLLTLLPRGLQLELRIRSTGAQALPLSPGWHPYFACPAALKDQVRGSVAGFTADRLGDQHEFDFGLPAPPDGRARFTLPGLSALRLDFSPEMRHLQFWSLPGRDFICLEPFYGPNDTVNGARRLEVAPGQTHTLWMKIELD